MLDESQLSKCKYINSVIGFYFGEPFESLTKPLGSARQFEIVRWWRIAFLCDKSDSDYRRFPHQLKSEILTLAEQLVIDLEIQHSSGLEYSGLDYRQVCFDYEYDEGKYQHYYENMVAWLGDTRFNHK